MPRLNNSFILGSTYFLDDYSPLMCFSLHQVDSANSDLIRVRRSSDSTEQDFNATEITDGTLTTFTGAGDGFIAKWYNLGSGGSTYDLVQTTAADQPRIVSSGTLDTDPNNGNVALYFDGTNYFFDLSTSYDMPTSHTQVFVFNRASSGIKTPALGNKTLSTVYSLYWFTDNSTYFKPSTNAAGVFASSTATGDFLDFIHYSSSSASLFRNNVGNANNPRSHTDTTGSVDVFARRNTDHLSGYVQFYTLFTTDESANRTAIQDKVNNQLSIY